MGFHDLLMHGTHGEERADRHAALTGAAMREDEDGGAIAQDRCFGLLADLLQALLHSRNKGPRRHVQKLMVGLVQDR